MTEWMDIAKAVGEGLAIASPIIGMLTYFHNQNKKTQQDLKSQISELKTQGSELNTDFDGLRMQLAASDLAHEKRFVLRDDLAQTVTRFDEAIRELNRILLDFLRGGAVNR